MLKEGFAGLLEGIFSLLIWDRKDRRLEKQLYEVYEECHP